MARELESTISEVFTGFTVTCGTHWYYSDNHVSLSNKKVYMDIPINQSVFELPTFAFDIFMKTLENKEFDKEAIVAVLRTRNRVPRYVTLNRYMRDILLQDFQYDTLVKLEVKDNGSNEPLIYYATHGMILDSQFTPIMMCSWLMERDVNEYGDYHYTFLRPIIRIDPNCYVARGNSMERFIANKLPMVALDNTIHMPGARRLANCCTVVDNWSTGADLKIEIDKCPFVLRHTETPSISTTNEKLLKLAIDYIDEVIQ